MNSTTTSVVKERVKPELITVGNKTIITGGRWNDDKMADYILERGNKKWIPTEDLAKVLGSNTMGTRKRVRAHIASLFRTFLKRDMFLAVEYGGEHGSTTAVKIADVALEEDRQAVSSQLDRMWKRKQITQDRYEKSMRLLNAMKDERSAPGSSQEISLQQLVDIRALNDFDLTMLICEIHDHGWPIAARTLAKINTTN